MERVFAELHDAYVNSTLWQKSCMVCLTNIKSARRIIDSELSLQRILKCTGVPQSYTNCMSIELNLSKYVGMKEEFSNKHKLALDYYAVDGATNWRYDIFHYC